MQIALQACGLIGWWVSSIRRPDFPLQERRDLKHQVTTMLLYGLGNPFLLRHTDGRVAQWVVTLLSASTAVGSIPTTGKYLCDEYGFFPVSVCIYTLYKYLYVVYKCIYEYYNINYLSTHNTSCSVCLLWGYTTIILHVLSRTFSHRYLSYPVVTRTSLTANRHIAMLRYLLLISFLCKTNEADMTTEEVQYLNELNLEKLLRLKNSLKDFSPEYNNITSAPFLSSFGAQAMAIKASNVKRTDYEDALFKKNGYGKISNIFSMSVTTLAFLAFGGYLLCLIVQAVKSKQNTVVTTPSPAFFVNAGIKRPQATFSSYGRRTREKRELEEVDVGVPAEELFSVLVQLCEGYAKWTKKRDI
ncbi:uncharacterized protein LOC112048178 [Bicyclus anynana]|uniref:Uncharacterized protein LOC112048178 n=1 Tax=Bicyclus anynana TaxID=110368 RepID=A0A6J1NE56_BICAN|nr:uncharacterized protein LOC112048178 [Bicyclus anynana]